MNDNTLPIYILLGESNRIRTLSVSQKPYILQKKLINKILIII